MAIADLLKSLQSPEAKSYLQEYQLKLYRGHYGGLNALDSFENLPQGSENDPMVESPDLTNVYSDPLGAITNFPGETIINNQNQIVEGGNAKAITGLFYDGEISGGMAVIGGSKFYDTASLTSAAIAYWNLGETTGIRVDSVGGNNLTEEVGPPGTFIQAAAGISGNAVWFENSPPAHSLESLFLLDNAALSVGTSKSRTWAFWAYLDSKPAHQMDFLSKFDSNSNNREYRIFWDNTVDRIQCSISSDGTGANTTTVTASSFGSPPLTTWFFVHVTYNHVLNQLAIAINRGTVNTTTHAGGIFDGTATFRLGSRANDAFGFGTYFYGRLDEVGIWSNLLTSSELDTYYTTFSGAGLGGHTVTFNVDQTSTVTITSDPDNLVDAIVADGLSIFVDRRGDAAWKWSGSGNPIAALGGSPPSPVYYAVSYDRRTWLFDYQKGYFSAQDNAESWDTVNWTVPFETLDGSKITMAKHLGDSIYIGKDGANANQGHLFRLFRTGNEALPYDIEEIQTGGIGPISQQGTLAVDEDLLFPAKDGNIYLLRGNHFIKGGIGRKIQPYILSTFNLNRLQYTTAGLIRDKHLAGFAFSLAANSTHSIGFWYDYFHSVPGERDLWYKTNQATFNAITERVVSGQYQTITGDYNGYYSQQLLGTDFSGVTINAQRVTPWHHVDSPLHVKLIAMLYLLLTNTAGTLTIEYQTDFNTTWTSARSVTATSSAIVETLIALYVTAKRIRFRFTGNRFTIYSYGIVFDTPTVRLTLGAAGI